MSGVLRLLLFQARRDRVAVPVWILGITLLSFATSAAVATQFGDEAAQVAILTLAAANPAFLFLRGLPDGTGVGAVVFFQGYAFTAVLAGLMSTLLVVRHTRSDEELGRAELLGSVPIPRAASLTATLLLGTAANLVLAVFVAGAFIAAGLPAAGSAAAGAAVGSVGTFFVALAAVAAQALPSGRSANGAAAGLVGVAYLVRGIGDALGTPSADLLHVASAWPSLLSPIGWGQRTRPFSSPDLAFLLVPLAAAAVLAALAVVIRRRRDVGASLLPERLGKERAGLGGRSFVGLAWRLQRSTLAGWCVGAAALGAVAGVLSPMASETVSSIAPLRELIARLVPGGQTGLIDVFVTALLGMAGVFAAAAGIQAVLRMRAEEAEGRAEILLSAPVSRARWLGANLFVAAVSAAVVSTTAGAAAAVGLAVSGTSDGPAWSLVPAALAHVPAALVFATAAAVAFALAPRLSILVAWGVLAVAILLGEFGELFGLPAWLQDASPFRHSSAMPVESFNQAGAVGLLLVAAAGASLAAYFLRRRDLAA
ncbi:ABC-2 type transport system permease protein [Pseudarthrobacter oxydans]|uniref:ABC-2 type transport system permease protein n=1 Tax=Pseudarthrobacter oxydans TaxID=1671 RepID=A0AAW8N8T6_PSEOX|nr:polyketide antibiotic transporter [Pseudarthrobacter oxydans]MDR6792990.1 ABC-2 type transport system permease protein [Pseudarthrobacter oxydans]MDR7163876.1 ABC-2 type transport system permease protein [Pseudarthrobacter oxydans]